MKLFLIVLSCVFITSIAQSQEVSNKQRLAELPELIEQEAAKENYELAGKLQQELEIRENLEIAIKDKDYKKAAQLREDLNNLEKKPSTTESTSSRPTPSEKKNENVVFYADFTVAGMNMYTYDYTTYVETYDENGYYIGSTTTTQRKSDLMYGLNVKIGSKFYFGPGTKNLRVGIDANYLSLNLGIHSGDYGGIIPNLNLSIARPGVVLTLLVKENMGFDIQLNSGLVMLISEYNDTPLPIIGYSINPQIKYWYKNIGVGLEYNFGDFIDENIRYHHFGLSFGLRF